MKRVILFRRDLRYQIRNTRLVRGKDDWESIKSFPYTPVDEHAPPENVPHDIYNRDFYNFGNQGRDAQVHFDDKFFQLRQWQHLHLVPKDGFIGWTHGSVIMKYFLYFFPALVLLYYFHVYPAVSEKNKGRTFISRTRNSDNFF